MQLALFQPEIDSSWSKMTIRHTQGAEPCTLVVPLTPSPLSLLDATTYQVSIFGTTAIGADMGEEASSFFSHHLKQDMRLLYIHGSGRREIPGSAYIPKQLNSLSLALNEGLQPQRIRFADAAPLLVTTTASEEELRLRLQVQHRGEDIIKRLRPNLHIDVGDVLQPFDEDTWSTLLVHTGTEGAQTVLIKCIFRCVRCLSLNADPDTGQYIQRSRQLYGLLAPDRRVNEAFKHKPVFGQYAFAGVSHSSMSMSLDPEVRLAHTDTFLQPAGAVIRVGDAVEVTERGQT